MKTSENYLAEIKEIRKMMQDSSRFLSLSGMSGILIGVYFYLGLLQVILGLIAALFPSFGLFLWALGFGVLHIFYGSLMYFRYEHNTIQWRREK